MSELLAKVRVILKAWPTWAAAFTAVLGVVAAEVIPLLPEQVGVRVAGWVAVALSVIAAATAVVRRVTPVLPAERGVLPPPPPPSVT
jgi:hypothetical protein